MRTIHARIEGRVQGVFFRDCTRQEARRLGITGWVKNMPDGAVEGTFAGPVNRIDEMIKWLGTGSPHAIVAKVDIHELHEQKEYSDFNITY